MPKATLTNDITVRNLKAEKGRKHTEYADKTNRGLLLKVSEHGEKRWYYRYRQGSQRKFVPLGNYPSTPVADALALYQRHKESKVDPWAEHQAIKLGEATRLTLAQLADRYIDKYAKPFKRSWERDKALLDRNVLGRIEGFPVPAIADNKADEITRRDLLRVVGKVADRNAWVEARKTARVLSKLFNWGMEKGHIDASPAARLAPSPPKPVRLQQIENSNRTLTDAEIVVVWNALRQETEPWAGVLALLLLTGQRPGEVCNMEWRHIDLGKGDWLIPAENSKNGREHLVSLPESVVKFLSSLSRQRKYIFPASKVAGPISPARINRKLNALLENEGVEHFSPHRIRATVATRLQSLDIPHRHIQAVLNHTPQDVTAKHYAKYDFYDEKRQALTRWCAHLDRIVNGQSDVVVPIRR